MNQERDVPLGGKFDKTAAFIAQRLNERLDHRGLQLQSTEPVFAAQLAEFLDLRRLLAHWIEHHQRQAILAFIGKKVVDFLQQPAVLEGVGYLLQARAVENDLTALERLDLEDDRHDERKNYPAVHAQRTPLARHRNEVLRVGKIAAEIKHQVRADVVVDIDDHG